MGCLQWMMGIVNWENTLNVRGTNHASWHQAPVVRINWNFYEHYVDLDLTISRSTSRSVLLIVGSVSTGRYKFLTGRLNRFLLVLITVLTGHLIKDCDYYEKKMAREAEFKKQRVFNTGNEVAKPVWTNANRVNHTNQFVPRSVQLNTGRTNINSVRPRVHTVNSNVNTVRSRQPVPTRTSNSFSLKRPQMNQFNQRRHFSKSHSSVKRPFAKNTAQMSHSHAVKGNWGSANCDYKRIIHEEHGRYYVYLHSDAQGTMTELGHFNLFSISHICDKQHKVLFTETGCLVVSSDFKMPDENQILLKMECLIGLFTDSMNYIPVSLENQANPYAGASEVTNSAGTSQKPNSNASEEKDEGVELIVVPSAVKNTEEKASSTDTSEDNPKILAFRRELEEIALKHLGTVSENNSTSTPSVNSGSEPVNTGRLDPDDSPMPELEIFHKSETGIFDEASYDEEGVIIMTSNSYQTEIEVSPTPTLRIHNIHPKSQILGDPKSSVKTRSKVQQKSGARALFNYIQKQQRNNLKITTIFQMTSMGELTFFLGLQVKQNTEGIFISQDKYVAEIHKKFDLVSVKTAITHGDQVFGNMKRGFRGVPRPLLPAMLSIANPSTGQEAPSVTQPQPSSSVVPPTPPSTQPIPSEATTIPPFSQPAPPTLYA
ncbi:ribonuclease H-like domain-containing protein [Tanacetum coccineum]|uniref:Ribonuclease H-like domain-containing protein n=1 Tax=Tanacetum coccineum TaxID=301880 RepID=A0ABQ5D8A8_9ASTR